jgi:tetratricopeptide (TPR) repeat protein
MRLFTLCFAFFAALAASASDSGLAEQVAALFREHKWAEAQGLLEKTIAVQPDNAEAQFYLGTTFLNRNDGEQAIVPLERAVQLAPKNSEYLRNLGDAYGLSAQKAGLFSKLSLAKKCKAAYEAAIGLDPRNINARRAFMEYCRLAPGIVGGGMDRAYEQAAEIKKLDPVRGRLAYASLYTVDKKYSEALAIFAEVLKDTPDDYDALCQFGRFAAMSGLELDRGLASLQKCLTLTPPPGSPGPGPANWRIGNILERKGDRPGARAAYEAALKAEPSFDQPRKSLEKLNAK